MNGFDKLFEAGPRPRVVQLILDEISLGHGTTESPCRRVPRLTTLDGCLVALGPDPFEQFAADQRASIEALVERTR